MRATQHRVAASAHTSRFLVRAAGRTKVLRAAITEPDPGRVLVETNLEGPLAITRFTVTAATVRRRAEAAGGAGVESADGITIAFLLDSFARSPPWRAGKTSHPHEREAYVASRLAMYGPRWTEAHLQYTHG